MHGLFNVIALLGFRFPPRLGLYDFFFNLWFAKVTAAPIAGPLTTFFLAIRFARFLDEIFGHSFRISWLAVVEAKGVIGNLAPFP